MIFENKIEGFLIMSLNMFQIIKGVDIKQYAKEQETFDKDNPCNIYFILKRKRVTVDKQNVKIENNKVHLPFLIHDEDRTHTIEANLKFQEVNSKLIFHSEYPYNRFSITDGNTHIFGGCPAIMLDNFIAEDHKKEKIISLLDYEILYIGQAHGKEGERDALDRLISHEKLQRIYSDCTANNPDSEIWVMLTNFSQLSILSVNGLIKCKTKNSQKEDKRASDFFHNNGFDITDKQKLILTEAALIKYFKPIYNIEFKDSFPSNKHTSYSDCYNLDLKSMLIEVDTSDVIARKLYNSNVKRQSRHCMHFNFNISKDRYDLLDLDVSFIKKKDNEAF